METSPAAVKFAGNDVVKSLSDTENIEDAVSKILKRFPVVVPLVPMFKANKSPVAGPPDAGDQSRLTSDPVPAAPVKPVEVDLRSSSVPEEKTFDAPVESWANLPVVKVADVAYNPVPEVRAEPLKTKAEVVVVPETTEEVNVWEPVPEVKLSALEVVLFPTVIVWAKAVVPMLIIPAAALSKSRVLEEVV